MRTLVLAVGAVMVFLQTATAQSATPSAAMISMRDRFEAGVMAIEDQYAHDPDGFRRAVAPIALRVFGADWSVVREEAQRTLAILPEIDLAPYASATQTPGFFSSNNGKAMNEIMPFMNPAGYAMMRFWDAEAVGMYIATIAVPMNAGRDDLAILGIKTTLVPMRVYKSRFASEDVLATRWMRSMVIIPYATMAEGFIVPDFERVRAYPLQR